MASQEDTRSEAVRAKRKFQPIVEATLERREVLSTASPVATAEVPPTTPYVVANSSLPYHERSTENPVTPTGTNETPTPVSAEEPTAYLGDIATTSVGSPDPQPNEMVTTGGIRRTPSGQRASTTDWNTMAGWSWLSGVWKSNTKIDFMDTLARNMGARNARFPAIPSMDTWLTATDRYIGRTALAAQQQTAMPLDGLVIKPGGTGGQTTLAMNSADGTPPVEMPMTSSNRNSATFTGLTPIFETTTDQNGQEVTTTTTGAPVRVNVTKRNPTTMRITAEMYTEGRWTRMFTYTATKTRTAAA